MATATNTNAKVNVFIIDVERAHQIVHGDDQLIVQTDGGPVKSLAYIIRELAETNVSVSDQFLQDLSEAINGRADTMLETTDVRINQEADGALDELILRVNQEADGILALSVAAKNEAEQAALNAGEKEDAAAQSASQAQASATNAAQNALLSGESKESAAQSASSAESSAQAANESAQNAANIGGIENGEALVSPDEPEWPNIPSVQNINGPIEPINVLAKALLERTEKLKVEVDEASGLRDELADSGAGMAGYDPRVVYPVRTVGFNLPIRVEAFGAVPGLGVSVAQQSANTVAFQDALDFAEAAGRDVEALAQFYVLRGAGLEIGASSGLIGRGTDEWEPVYPNRPKKWEGTNLIFAGAGEKRWSALGITSMSAGGGVRPHPTLPGVNLSLTSFHNSDASGSAPSTTRLFSAAITNKAGATYIRLKGLRIVPWFDGVAGYDNTASTGLGDDWDFGVWLRNSEYADVLDVQAVGYWRQAGRAVTTDWSVESRGERNRFTRCKFQGRVGTMQRGSDMHAVSATTADTMTVAFTPEFYFPKNGTVRGHGSPTRLYTYTGWSVSGNNVTFTGVSPDPAEAAVFMVTHLGTGWGNSEDVDVYSYDLYHQSGSSNTELGVPLGSCFEMSGYPGRGCKFTNTKYHGRGLVLAHMHICFDATFFGPQFEGGGLILASPVTTEQTWASAPVSDTRNLRMYGDALQDAADLTLFTPRTGWVDSLQAAPRGYVGANTIIRPLRTSLVLSTNGAEVDVRKNNNSTNIARFLESGNVEFPSGGLSLGSSTGSNGVISGPSGYGLTFRSGTTALAAITGSSDMIPWIANTGYLGTSANPWAGGRTQTAIIVTSDKNAKRDIRELTDAEIRAWERVRPKVFRMRDSVSSKGDDARLHAGFIAQEVEAAFRSEGLDPARYALWCADPVVADVIKTRTVWQPVTEIVVRAESVIEMRDGKPVQVQRTTEEAVPVMVESPLLDEAGSAVVDDEGAPIIHRHVKMEQVVEEYIDREETGETQYGLRYDQCLAIEVAYIRQKLGDFSDAMGLVA